MSGTLPLRRWLIVALVMTFVVPFALTATMAAALVWRPAQSGNDAARLLTSGAASWNDPAWQVSVTDTLRAQGVEFVLYEDGAEIFRSTADPLAGTNAAAPGPRNWWAGDSDARLARELVLPGDALQQRAYIYSLSDPPSSSRAWLLPVIGFSALFLTLAGIAWVLGRMVVRPLAATSDAARQIAAGDLDISLPTSRVREVAEVNSAFEVMSGGLRESVEQQVRVEQERRLFISAIAHDLRTPLFALRGYLSGLQQGVARSPEQMAHYVGVAQEKADALERLIADLFDYSRLEYLDQAPDRKPADVRDVLLRFVEGFRPLAEAKQVALDLDLTDVTCVAEIDEHLMARAVENLLDNAVRYTPHGGRVTVRCARDEGKIEFTVIDDGPGIAAEDLPRIFSPLYRAESSRNRRTAGAGLGLTIARRILRAHGGELTAANGERGAEFRGTLPSVE
ncbi:MAG: HAMP domain-containing histidine kinase [Thermomicrobiales bacterium]|nr:HAMP domain-containing histidine kinase [Thermomicrobiales bacterium]